MLDKKNWIEVMINSAPDNMWAENDNQKVSLSIEV